MSGKGGEVPEGTEGEAGGKVGLIEQQRFKRGERVAPRREKTAKRMKEGLRAQDEGRAGGRVSPRGEEHTPGPPGCALTSFDHCCHM